MKQSKTIGLYFIVSTLSILLSVKAIISNPVLSSDSVLYLRTAEAFAVGGLSGALEIYSWPFLSILIAQLQSLSGLSFENSAYAISVFFYAVICCGFIGLVRDLGGSFRTQCLAAFVVLTYPTLNDYRDYIIRDHGFWAFLLISLVLLLRYQSRGGLRNAIGWVVSCLVAFAFRVEALAFLLFVPLMLLVGDKLGIRSRLATMSTLYLVMVTLCLLLLFSAIGVVDSFSVDQVLLEIKRVPISINEFFQGISASTAVIDQALANPYLSDDVGFVFVSGMLVLLFFQGMHAFLPNNLILLIWGRGLIRSPFAGQSMPIILGYLLVIFLYLVFAILTKQFINDRFMVPFCLLMLLWLPFYANAIIDQSYNQRIRWAPILLCLLLGYSLLDSLISTGTSKQHIADALVWLNTNSSKESKLLTNNAHIAYFSNQQFDDCAYNLNPARAYFKKNCPGRNLLVIEMQAKDKALAKRLKSLQKHKGFRVVKSFSNEKQDEIIILKATE